MDLAKEVQDAQALMQHDSEAALSALELLFGKATASFLKGRKDRVFVPPYLR